MNKENLEHAVINQLEADLQGNDFEPISELLQLLMTNEDNIEVLVGYLSDAALKNLEEGLTIKRY